MPLGLRRAPVLVLVALIGLGAGVAFASCGGEPVEGETLTVTQTITEPRGTTATTPDEAEKPTSLLVTIEGGVPTGGIVRATVDRRDQVVLRITSDVADEVHVHGYDLTRDVAAGGTVRIEFTATIPGRFEVELEERGIQIAELTVEP